MIAKLENPALLAKVVEILSEIVTEVRIKVNEFGLSINALDPANVSMAGFRIPRSAFSQFEADNEVIGINLDNLKQILKRCSSGSSLTLEKKENLLAIQINDKIKRNFTLNLVDVEGEDIDFYEKESRMEFSAKVEINSSDLIASIEDCGVVSDACSFAIADGKFIIEAKSLNSAMSEFSGDEAKIDGENSKSKYSLEYLGKFIKGAKLCDKTLLYFANDHPLKIEFKTQHMELDFILAPRVEEMED